MSSGLRAGIVVLGLALGAIAVVGASRALPLSRGRSPEASIVAEARRLSTHAFFREHGAGVRGPRVLAVGDSMLIPVADEQGRFRGVPGELGRLLRAEKSAGKVALERADVTPLVLPGLGISDQYALADVIVGAAPDVVIIELNPVAFNAKGGGLWRRSDFAGWISPRRLPEALSLPLYGRLLTADELLFKVGLVQAGLDGAWMHLVAEQGKLNHLRRSLSREVDQVLGDAAQREALAAARVSYARQLTSVGEGARPNARSVRAAYGIVLGGVDVDHPTLQVLGALVAGYRRAGITSLVFVSPINVEHVDALGLLRRDGLSTSFAATRAVVERAGGRFVDLHAALPDAGFRDANGHLSVDPPVDGVGVVARALADELRALLAEAVPSDREPR